MARVLFVLGGALDVGGAENQLIALAPALRVRGFSVSVLCLWRRGSQADQLSDSGVAVHALPRFLGYMRGPFAKLARFVGGLFTVRQRIAAENPDIVHFILPHGYLVGGLAAGGGGRHRCVMSRRGLNRYLDGRPFTRRFERYLHRRMDALLGNSCRVSMQLLDEGGSVDRVGLIYNGLADSRYTNLPPRETARQVLDCPCDVLVIVKVANLWAYKGHADLLVALSQMPADAAWRLWLIGRDEGEGPRLRRLAERLGVNEHVYFVGESADVPTYLAAADIAVCASHEEGFSNAVLEYLAAGLPSVVTDVGGNREAVADAGLVVEAGDVDALAGALQSLMHSDARVRLAARARQQARNFSMDQCVNAHVSLYRELLDEGTVPAALRATTRCRAQPPLSDRENSEH